MKGQFFQASAWWNGWLIQGNEMDALEYTQIEDERKTLMMMFEHRNVGNKEL